MDCVICTDAYRDPRMLSCGHSFCFPCLTQLQKTSRNCPTCREPVIPKTWRKEPPKNYALSQITEKKRVHCPECDDLYPRKSFYFCENERAMVCATCVLANHSGHAYIHLTKHSENRMQQTCQTQLQKIHETLHNLDSDMAESLNEQGKVAQISRVMRHISTQSLKASADRMLNSQERQHDGAELREFVAENPSDIFKSLGEEMEALNQRVKDLFGKIYDSLMHASLKSSFLGYSGWVNETIRLNWGVDLKQTSAFASLTREISEAFAEQSPANAALFKDYDWPWAELQKYRVVGVEGGRYILLTWNDRLPPSTSSLEEFQLYYVTVPTTDTRDFEFASADERDLSNTDDSDSNSGSDGSPDENDD